ncbi:hypothetical protein TL16_g09780 [Triparma laevis f. inornata]|uniref:Pre-mRNA-splicing factor CWC24 n=2 Tax=Triparma laevis TaxID=1534972 RepID=A0A9W7A7Y7_9STRA|nr:hypothetical protein TrLO_g5903 [Triparma laevis f. longispina]GMH83995.1 hypothetical protein TL16_g09780 [Triparma laevis f. inornata]
MFKKRKKPTSTTYRAASTTDDTKDDTIVCLPTTTNSQQATSSTSKPSTTSSVMHTFDSTDPAELIARSNDAFRTLETEEDAANDNRSRLEKKAKLDISGQTNDTTGIYTGAAGYSSFVNPNFESIAASKHNGTRGQLRANTTIRVTSQIDYQPDVCKDYQKTGYCGFGDTCVFMHDRGSYKGAAEIEGEWEERKKRVEEERAKAVRVLEGDVEEETYKFKYGYGCPVCKSWFKEPVETACGHFYCEACIRTLVNGEDKCLMSGKDLGGTWKDGGKLRRDMKKGGFEDFKEMWEKRRPKEGGGEED